MAKRKRLGAPISSSQPAPEVKSYPLGLAPKANARPPIAQVAGDASALAAAETLAEELNSAQREGRLVTQIRLDQIDQDHILRDRILLDNTEMVALIESIKSRGQQTPIDLVDLGEGRYGLISGLRRITALQSLYDLTQDPAFQVAKALIKPVTSVTETYVAMVEENEIRADLSFYERARLAIKASDVGVFETPKRAIKTLFANATPARRSKVATFVKLHQMYGSHLTYPQDIPEKIGLALVKAGEADTSFVTKVHNSLDSEAIDGPAEERRVLDEALKPEKVPVPLEDLKPGLRMEAKQGRVVLSGTAVNDALIARLRAFLEQGD